MRKLIIGVVLFLLALKANAAVVTYDADDFTLHDVANDLLPGVTLSVIGTDLLLTGDSVIADKPGKVYLGNTDFVFGFSQTNHGTIGGGYQQVHQELRIDFDITSDSISILFATGNGLSAFNGILQAYDSYGVLLDEVITPHTPRLDTAWATITRTSNDIAYIQASGWGGTIASVDAIEFSVVPIPSALWLFGSGLIGLIGLARRK